MTAADVYLELHASKPLERELAATTLWDAELIRHGEKGRETVAWARGRTFDVDFDDYLFEVLDSIDQEFGHMAFAYEQVTLDLGYPLFVDRLAVEPEWQGHNIGPHLLVWMALNLGPIRSILLQPVPFPQPPRSRPDGRQPLSAGSGARKKVRMAYRRAGFDHLRYGTWYRIVDAPEAELEVVQTVMRVLEE